VRPDAATGKSRKKTLIGVGDREHHRHHGPDTAEDRVQGRRDGSRQSRQGTARVVYGQDTAIDALTAAIKLARAGLREPDKPIGSYLFSGPPASARPRSPSNWRIAGCRTAALRHVGIHGAHTVSRLIGAPPGYVGFDQGGLLTDGVDQHPYCVLLLDEIEKAHPDLFNILLQVMDHGKLTDHNGKKIDFRNVIMIMTTNAGASDMAKAAIGFGSSKREGDDMEAINRLFTPEFRNRLDAIIPFGSLPTKVIHMVVEKFVMQLEAQLADRNVTFDLGKDAVAWLADKGYDERMGARPLGRVIQEHIKKELAERASVRQAQARRNGQGHRREGRTWRDQAEAGIGSRRTGQAEEAVAAKVASEKVDRS
jgi:ATP-dependent Clp protease ATP-binding subunit ClpA